MQSKPLDNCKAVSTTLVSLSVEKKKKEQKQKEKLCTHAFLCRHCFQIQYKASVGCQRGNKAYCTLIRAQQAQQLSAYIYKGVGLFCCYLFTPLS